MHLEQIKAEVGRRLAAAFPNGSRNEISAADLRKWAIEYLSEYDEELSRFPELVAKPHWNLWMMDAHSDDALFTVLVFRPDGVEFLCGAGDATTIKQFAESEFPDDLEQFPAEISSRFSLRNGSLQLSREEAEAWLGRGW